MSTTDKIRDSAKEALATLTDVTKSETLVVRKRVYAWLEDMSARCGDACRFIPDGHADKAVLQSFMRQTFPKGCLMSRQSDEAAWTPTSFFFDPDTSTLNCKVGANPYQPIAYDDGEHLLQLENAKLLWARQWGVAITAELAPPFDIVTNTGSLEFSADKGFVNESDLAQLQKAFAELQDELGMFIAEQGKDEKKTKEADYRLRETVKLARIWSTMLDAKLKIVAKQRCLGANFENANIADVAKASLEYMAMRMDSHAAAIKSARIQLVMSELTPETRQLVMQLCTQLRNTLLASVVNKEVLSALIAKTMLLYTLDDETQTSIRQQEDAIDRATILYNAIAPCLSAASCPVVGACAPPAQRGGSVLGVQNGPSDTAADVGDAATSAAPGKPSPDTSSPGTPAPGAAVAPENNEGPQG